MSKHELILACMIRHVEREKAITRVQLPLRLWFEDRLRYLEDQYRLAINEADNVIGKQRLYHTRPQLTRRHYGADEGGARPPYPAERKLPPR